MTVLVLLAATLASAYQLGGQDSSNTVGARLGFMAFSPLAGREVA